MPTAVKMPRLGESVAEGTVAIWLKREGEWVEKDEPLAEIVTDKINAELPSPIAGRLEKILVEPDGTVAVGVDIALIEEGNEIPLAIPTTPPPPVHVADVHIAKNTTNVVAVIEPAQRNERQRISPLAQRLAREHAIDLSVIAGTGMSGRVRKEDILAYLEQQTAPEHLVSAVGMMGEEVIIPSRMRVAIAEHMVRSKRTSPHATTLVEVDMTTIAKWLENHKEQFRQSQGYGISYVSFVMKAVCEGLRAFPLMNASWTEDNKIIVKKRINLGLAIATEDGLVVPTIYDTDHYTLAGVAKQIALLAQRARSNKLTVQDLQNSTFVVNNPGTFGTIISMPIINQPHAGILSMDAVVKRPVVIEDDAIAVRSMMYICLSFDHRILDGAGAAGFLQVVRTKLQSYGREIDIY